MPLPCITLVTSIIQGFFFLLQLRPRPSQGPAPPTTRPPPRPAGCDRSVFHSIAPNCSLAPRTDEIKRPQLHPHDDQRYSPTGGRAIRFCCRGPAPGTLVVTRRQGTPSSMVTSTPHPLLGMPFPASACTPRPTIKRLGYPYLHIGSGGIMWGGSLQIWRARLLV